MDRYIRSVQNFDLKGSDQWKMRGFEKLASVRRLYQTVAIDVCLFFYEAVVFSATISVSGL